MPATYNLVRDALALGMLAVISIQIRKVQTKMATRDDLNAAIDQLTSTLNTALADLLAKIQAGTVTTPEDFSAEIAKIQALTQSAQTDDPGPQTGAAQ